MTEPRTVSARTLVFAVTALAAAAALLLLLYGARAPEADLPGAVAPESVGPARAEDAPTASPGPPGGSAPAPDSEAARARSEGYAPDEPRPQTLEVSGAGPHTLPAGGTFLLDAGSLPPDRPVAFDLALPDDAKLEHAAHAIRVVAEDGRLLHATAHADEIGVRLEVEPGWLSTGRYVVEVKTAEKTHFPLRRWGIEVH